MNIERIVGLVFSISLLLVLLFVVLTPQIDYQQEFTISDPVINEKTAEEEEVIEVEEKETEILKENPIFESDVANIQKSDFSMVDHKFKYNSKHNQKYRVIPYIQIYFKYFAKF